MSPILEEIIKSQNVGAFDGSIRRLNSNVPPEEGEFLQTIIKEIEAKTTLEVGLAYGISALYICEAIKNIPGSRHLVIDPNQFTDWEGIGMNNLKKGGFEEKVKFYGRPSHLVFPELEAAGTKIDFAFMDGWHSFDYALVDFFYIDRLLKVGGIVVIDDSNFRSLRKVCSYVLNNRSYRIYNCLKQKTKMAFLLRGTLSTIFSISPMFFYDFFKSGILSFIPYTRCIALIKEKDDNRRWDFHHEF